MNAIAGLLLLLTPYRRTQEGGRRIAAIGDCAIENANLKLRRKLATNRNQRGGGTENYR
jgi:hypothetical protein